jgi:hypothetical protein
VVLAEAVHIRTLQAQWEQQTKVMRVVILAELALVAVVVAVLVGLVVIIPV